MQQHYQIQQTVEIHQSLASSQQCHDASSVAQTMGPNIENSGLSQVIRSKLSAVRLTHQEKIKIASSIHASNKNSFTPIEKLTWRQSRPTRSHQSSLRSRRVIQWLPPIPGPGRCPWKKLWRPTPMLVPGLQLLMSTRRLWLTLAHQALLTRCLNPANEEGEGFNSSVSGPSCWS